MGKSTLINRLLGRDALATKGLRNDDKGRHTTTRRELIALPEGGVVIDTPGMREMGIESADFSKTFADIGDLEAECRFRDCTHSGEPGCAVQAAVAAGTLPAARLESYQRLVQELAFEQAKAEIGLVRLEKKRWKAIGKIQRDIGKMKGE